MPIDVRAAVSCSLGTLISGNISDEYVQGTGLVKTTGSVVISGLITPAIGTAVTFSWVKAGVTRSIPRRLRVLSSFADPFRRTTSVELGCKLTYLQDLKEPVDWTAFDDNTNTLTADDARIITIPIRAQSVAEKCLTELGITGSFSLSNQFSIKAFDLSSGYVQVLGDLLQSESMCGYLDASDVLQVFSLDQAGGTGPVIDVTQLIDISKIGSGPLPGEAVTVSYSTLKLDNNVTTDANSVKKRNWELSETIGLPTTVFVANPYWVPPLTSTTPDPPRARVVLAYNVPEFYEYNYIPRTVTTSRYDDWDRLVQRTAVTYVPLAELAADYVIYQAAWEWQNWFGLNPYSNLPQSLGIGIRPPAVGSTIYELSVYTTVEYEIQASPGADKPEGYEKVAKETTIQYEPFIKLSGSTPIYETALGRGVMPRFEYKVTPADLFVANRLEITYETSYDDEGAQISRTLTDVYSCYAYTQRGQRYLSSALQDVNLWEPMPGPYTFPGIFHLVSNGTADAVLEKASALTFQGTTEQITIGREIDLQRRPNEADRVNIDNGGKRVAGKSDLALALGSATAQRRTEFSLPYAPDDIFFKSGSTYGSTPSDAPQKAQLYGQVQNRLLLGNRNGMSIQAAPEVLPTAPFAPFIVGSGGLSALYRTNGTTWTFDASGLVVSTDALFWGGVGGTGTGWFPVAPGITTLPAAPATTTVNILNGAGAVVGSYQQMVVSNVVPVWQETRLVEATLRLRPVVDALPYELSLLAEVPATTRLGAEVIVGRLVDAPAGVVTIAALAPSVSVGAAVVVPAAATISIGRLTPAVYGGASVAVPAAGVAIEGLELVEAGKPRTTVKPPAGALSIAAVAPSVAAGKTVFVPAADVAVIGVVPAEIGIGNPITALSPLVWYDFADETTVTEASSQVSSITDKGSRGWTLTKSATGPTYATGINSLKCADWGSAGHSNYLRNTSSTSTNIAEIYVVLDANFGGTFQNYNGLVTGTGASSFFVVGNLNGTGFFAGSFNAAFVNGSGSNQYSSGILTTINSPALLRIKKTDNTTVNTTTGIQIGMDRTNSGRGWGGLIGEVIAFSSVLSDTDRSAVQSWLASKWNLTLV